MALLNAAPRDAQSGFYRSSNGAEIDLLLVFPNGALWAVEIKRSLSPKPERGFYVAWDDLRPAKRSIVYPGAETFPLYNGVNAIPLADLAALLIREGG